MKIYQNMCKKVEVIQSCLTLSNPMDCRLPSFSVHGILQARMLEWLAVPFSRGSSQGLNPGLLHCRQTLLSEPTRKPKNTRVGSLSLLQGIFPT